MAAQANDDLLEDIFKDFEGRRAGIIKALTTDFKLLYSQCNPEGNDNLSLFAFSDQTWRVSRPEMCAPTELPEPLTGINFCRDTMDRSDWRNLIAVRSDSWLMAVAFYFAFSLDADERNVLFQRINSLPSVLIDVAGAANVKNFRASRACRAPGLLRVPTPPRNMGGPAHAINIEAPAPTIDISAPEASREREALAPAIDMGASAPAIDMGIPAPVRGTGAPVLVPARDMRSPAPATDSLVPARDMESQAPVVDMGLRVPVPVPVPVPARGTASPAPATDSGEPALAPARDMESQAPAMDMGTPVPVPAPTPAPVPVPVPVPDPARGMESPVPATDMGAPAAVARDAGVPAPVPGRGMGAPRLARDMGASVQVPARLMGSPAPSKDIRDSVPVRDTRATVPARNTRASARDTRANAAVPSDRSLQQGMNLEPHDNAAESDEDKESDCEQDDSICGSCGRSYERGEFWIYCEVCKTWFHGKCVRVTPAKAKKIGMYACPECRNIEE